MQKGQMISFAEVPPGTVGKTWEELERGSPTVIPGMGITMEPGVLYETQYVASGPITATIAWINAQIGVVISGFMGVRTEYIIVEDNVLRHGYMIPQEAAAEARAFGLPIIGGIISAVMVVLIVIGIILIIVGMWTGKDPMTMLMELIPGLVVTAVGGVVIGVLPGKTKIVGLAPLGIGLYLLIQPFIPGPEPPPPTECEKYATEQECTAQGCYWYDNACHSIPLPQPGAEITTISID